MNNMTQEYLAESSIVTRSPEQGIEPNGESDGRRQTHYSLPRVLIRVDEVALSTERGARVLSPEEFAGEPARLTGISQEVIGETAEPPPAFPSAAASEADRSGAVLLSLSKDVRATRTQLAKLDGRIVELQEKSRDLGELWIKVESARERRKQVLASAMLAGRAADTVAIDKECSVAARAFEKRADESIAVEYALETLQAQRGAAAETLRDQEHTFKEARDAHLQTIMAAARLAVQFHEAITKARASELQMSAHYRARLQQGAGVALESNQLPSADALKDLVTFQAKADLVEADELTAIPPPPVPQSLGFVWADGFIHPDPEPAPDRQPEVAVGLVRSET